MGRIRTIKPEFPQSETMGKVSRDARLTFLLLFTLVDDSGTSRGNVAMLRRSLFPYDDVTQEQMDGWLSELADAKAIIRYQSAEGDNYIKIPKWAEHQKIDRASPSKLPQFDDNSTTIRRQFDESSRGLAVGLEGNGREWKGMDLVHPREGSPTSLRLSGRLQFQKSVLRF